MSKKCESSFPRTRDHLANCATARILARVSIFLVQWKNMFAVAHSEMDYLMRNLRFYFVFVNKKYTLILFLSARQFRNSNFRHSKETPSTNKQWQWTCIVFDFWPANRRGVGFDKTKATLTAMSKTNETYSISASIICVHFVPSLETHKN